MLSLKKAPLLFLIYLVSLRDRYLCYVRLLVICGTLPGGTKTLLWQTDQMPLMPFAVSSLSIPGALISPHPKAPALTTSEQLTEKLGTPWYIGQ